MGMVNKNPSTIMAAAVFIGIVLIIDVVFCGGMILSKIMMAADE
jgi:hypothetical protein